MLPSPVEEPGSPQSAETLADAAPAGAGLKQWLVDHALPLWSTTGVDRAAGGFFEKIDLQGRPVEEPRRARVVARQIYVFATAARRGWLPGADALVDHGLAFLLGRMRLADGTFAAAVAPDGRVVRGDFDLYEQAFVLFALAAAADGRPQREAALRGEAEALLARLRDGWSHPGGGFEESRPRSLPLRSNPHMHLLEAALAWAAISTGEARAVWHRLAAGIVDLCLTHFIDGNGALHELFGAEWQAAAAGPKAIVEPGHQFEWAWLLLRWADIAGSDAARRAGQRLLDIGENAGVDPVRGVAINQLDGQLTVVDPAAKLWPQTERIKAWHAARVAGRPDQQLSAERQSVQAVAGLSHYLQDGVPPGLWHEQLAAGGRFELQPCRASSLYHIVCAIDTLVAPENQAPQHSAGSRMPA